MQLNQKSNIVKEKRAQSKPIKTISFQAQASTALKQLASIDTWVAI